MTSPPVFERVLVGLVTAVCLVPTVVLLGAVGWSAVPSAVSQGCLIAAGVLLWRGPTRREGLSLLAAAALLGLSAMGTDTFAELGGYWLELGWLAFWAAVPPIAYVVFAHPQGRLGLRRHRWLLAAPRGGGGGSARCRGPRRPPASRLHRRGPARGGALARHLPDLGHPHAVDVRRAEAGHPSPRHRPDGGGVPAQGPCRRRGRAGDGAAAREYRRGGRRRPGRRRPPTGPPTRRARGPSLRA